MLCVKRKIDQYLGRCARFGTPVRSSSARSFALRPAPCRRAFTGYFADNGPETEPMCRRIKSRPQTVAFGEGLRTNAAAGIRWKRSCRSGSTKSVAGGKQVHRLAGSDVRTGKSRIPARMQTDGCWLSATIIRLFHSIGPVRTGNRSFALTILFCRTAGHEGRAPAGEKVVIRSAFPLRRRLPGGVRAAPAVRQKRAFPRAWPFSVFLRNPGAPCRQSRLLCFLFLKQTGL